MAGGKLDISEIGKRVDQALISRFADPFIDVNDNRAIALGPMAGDLRGAVQRGMAQKDDADAHAQFPFDIRPRISS